MPYKTRYGSHYHETYGCCGATDPCGSTDGLAPCSICCGGGSDGDGDGNGGGGFPGGGGSPSNSGLTEEQARGFEALVEAPRQAEGKKEKEEGEEGPLRPKPGPQILTQGDYEQSRREELGRSAETVNAGRRPGVAPTPEEEAILARIASLEAELAELRGRQAMEAMRDAPGEWEDEGEPASVADFPAIDGEFGEAQDSRDKGIRDYIEHFYGEMNLTDQGKQALYDESVSDSLSGLEWEVTKEMGLAERVPQGREEDALIAGIADRIEAEGYGDKLTAKVRRNLESDGDAFARRACDVVATRRRRRQDAHDYQVAARIAGIQGEVMEEMGLRGIRARDRERVADAIARRMEQEGLVPELTGDLGWRLRDLNAHTAELAVDRLRNGEAGATAEQPPQARPKQAKRPASRRRAASDPMEGMSAKEERAAFDKEFSTKEVDGYMGSRGYEGSKSGQRLYGKELSGAVRKDLKRWLGHVGVQKGDIRVRMHKYSGGMSMDVEAKLDRSRHAASENEFKDAYRRLFWQVTPRWGTVQTSRGPVDVARLTDHRVDQGKLMDDIIDTAWQDFRENGARVDTGHTRVSGNPWHEIYLNSAGREVARRTQAILDAYNYDKSNGMVDYFNSGFYASSHVVI